MARKPTKKLTPVLVPSDISDSELEEDGTEGKCSNKAGERPSSGTRVATSDDATILSDTQSETNVAVQDGNRCSNCRHWSAYQCNYYFIY